jgi:hypothetical protein
MRAALQLLLVLIVASPVFAASRVTLVNSDVPGVGFNDTAVVTPRGGNTGTTRGAQRLIAVQAAFDKWAAILNSDVEIVVDAAFSSNSFGTCTGTSATLAFANTIEWMFNFQGAPKADVLYPVALANKIAKQDLRPGQADIRIRFNPQVDNATCLGTTNWYYGLDGDAGSNVDLIATAMHELAHGLGFSGNVTANTGRFAGAGLPAVFDTHIFDNTTSLRWDQMTPEQRVVSAINDQNVVWDGSLTTEAARTYLPTPVLSVTAPEPVAKRYTISHTTGWSARITVAGITGSVAAPTDAAEPAGVDSEGAPVPAGTTTDGCSAFTNASAILGKFALIDRGRCTFFEKAQRAAAAGALGVVIANDDRPIVRMSAEVGLTVSLPVVMVTKEDGTALRGALATGVSMTMFADPQVLSGADQAGRVKLYMPPEISAGSSVYHFDVSADPDLLMEPQINAGLPHTGDLTVQQMSDIGWEDPKPTGPPNGRRMLKRGR